ncbi:hypothetical protein EDD37DRAFT_680158 [Exophiala viscosa]|uniref:uncharacterized protein n=1 Tax=Exophiala viscosa TaxID=2486360 RepID=UPI00219FC44D|nr:hypothetical protein EDD37DRAFT_680158 [Exophiala viscosa]
MAQFDTDGLRDVEKRNGVWFFDNASEEHQYFRGHTLLYILPDPVYGPNSPLRNNLFYSRVNRARAFGAVIVDTWHDNVTHVVVSTHQTWDGMLEYLRRHDLPPKVQVVRDGYLDECHEARAIVEPSALQHLTPGDNQCPPAGHMLNLPRAQSIMVLKERKDLAEGDSDEDRPAKESTRELYNPFQGNEMAKQLDETCQQFLQRLIPSQVVKGEFDRLAIANPAADWSCQPNLKAFKYRANSFLELFLDNRWDMEKDHREDEDFSRGEKARLRMLRTSLEVEILYAAKQTNVICGRWLLPATAKNIDKNWQVVVESTLQGGLGCAAEVTRGERVSFVISVYTCDINDKGEAKRVLNKLRELQVFNPGPKPIYYKALAYTEVELRAKNEYKLRTSLYNSDEI